MKCQASSYINTGQTTIYNSNKNNVKPVIIQTNDKPLFKTAMKCKTINHNSKQTNVTNQQLKQQTNNKLVITKINKNNKPVVKTANKKPLITKINKSNKPVVKTTNK